MCLGDRDVAGSFGFLLDGRFSTYLVGYEPEFAAYSVGRQATLALIEHGIGQGWREVDLMKGAERYKFDYTRRCGHIAEHWIAKSDAKLRLLSGVAALRGRLCTS